MFYKQQYVHIYLYFTSTNICTKISQRVKTYLFYKKVFEQNGENSQSRARISASYFVNLWAKKKTGMVTIMLFYAL